MTTPQPTTRLTPGQVELIRTSFARLDPDPKTAERFYNRKKKDQDGQS